MYANLMQASNVFQSKDQSKEKITPPTNNNVNPVENDSILNILKGLQTKVGTLIKENVSLK